ncbi:MAG TPA: tetratricopeptide repeat protein [Ktedonobacteraceae bacterium]|nr:tetratricopeptide repeat protein [Ktedonobacteraceae bacterium]
MSKKTKQSKQKRKVTITSPSQVDTWLGLIERQMMRGHYAEAVPNCERLLNYLPQHTPRRAYVLTNLGTAQGMLQNFPESYEAFTAALALQPNNVQFWYNRSEASRFTDRYGQALRDIERAVELNTSTELAEKFDEALMFSRNVAEESMKARGPNFTLDQLIEQEELLQQGLKLMKANNWAEAGQAFEAGIAIGDGLPQPWGNLGICLMMQERYDEAEVAWKRALVIDPEYTLAKNNLASLPEVRRIGPPDTIAMNDAWDSKIKHSIIFTRE